MLIQENGESSTDPPMSIESIPSTVPVNYPRMSRERKFSSRYEGGSPLEKKISRTELRVEQPFDTRSMGSVRSKMSFMSHHSHMSTENFQHPIKSEEERTVEKRQRFW